MSTLIGLFFGALIVAGILGMVRIQRAEYFAAREAERKQKARLDAFRVRSCRPDGD